MSRCLLAAALSAAFLAVALGDAYCQKASARQKYVKPGESPIIVLDRANGLVTQGRCDDAIPLLESLLAKAPRLSAAREMLSDCYLKTGRAQDAATLLERCLAEEPDNFSYVRNLGLAYVDLGRKEKAVEIWRSLLKNDERSAVLYGAVAKLEQEAGFYDEALETLRAGAKLKQHEERYARELIHLERILGRNEDAFRETLLLVGQREDVLQSEIGTLADIFRESKKKERLVAIVDSVAAVRNDKGGIFRTLKTDFLLEDARYGEARKALFGAGAALPREEELYSLLIRMEQLSQSRKDDAFTILYDDMTHRFIERYGSSALAPRVLLMMASSKRDAARNAGAARGPETAIGANAPREKLLEEALVIADSAKHHRAAGPYAERAAMFKARVLFDDLHRSDEALAELDGIGWPTSGRMAEAAELRVRILLASNNAAEAETQLTRLAGSTDSSLATLGSYGVGRLDFLTGKYKEAVKALSELAEKHPSSKWTNDALELAMDVEKALPEGSGALDLYRGAVLSSETGNAAFAIDTLTAIERRYPSSSLAPRAIFMKAELEAGLGGTSAARADFTSVAERFPLHDLAPRALERLAGLAERAGPDEAIKQYGALMERYPDYPFIERVRERYVALAKSGEPAPQKKSGAGHESGAAGKKGSK